MRVRDPDSMNLVEIRAEIELIESEARRMAPTEAEFRRRFPTMANRLKSLLERRTSLEEPGAAVPPSPPADVGERIEALFAEAQVPPPPRRAAPRRDTGRGAPGAGAAFLDLREQLLDGEAARSTPAAPAAQAGDAARRDLAAREAELQRLREERDDWRGKAEGAHARLARATELTRELEQARNEIGVLTGRVAEHETNAPARGAAHEQLETELETLRRERETMVLAHGEELERIRVRHREDVGILEAHAEGKLAQSLALHEAALAELTADRDAVLGRLRQVTSEGSAALDQSRAEAAAAREQRVAESAALAAQLEGAQATSATLESEKRKLLEQLERATLNRNVLSLGVIQAIQRIAARIESDERFGALPVGEPVLGEARRSLFQGLERLADRARGIGTDATPETFLHAVAECLEAIPEWTGALLESLTTVATSSREVLSDREAEISSARSALETASRRTVELGAELDELRGALDATAEEARRAREEFTARIGDLAADLAEERNRLGTVERELAAADAERARLAADLEQARARADALHAAMQRSLDSLRSSLES